jgi:hypothetical protein
MISVIQKLMEDQRLSVPLLIGALAFELTYLAATAVALWHSDPRRRADALRVLAGHPLHRGRRPAENEAGPETEPENLS